jgi:hypothetical protein
MGLAKVIHESISRSRKYLDDSAAFAACTPDTTSRIGGATLWTNVPQGRLKAQVFAKEKIRERPILVLILHGDIPNPRPDISISSRKPSLLDGPIRKRSSGAALMHGLRSNLGWATIFWSHRRHFENWVP